MSNLIIYSVSGVEYYGDLDTLLSSIPNLLKSNLLALGDQNRIVKIVEQDTFNPEDADPSATIVEIEFYVLQELERNFFSFDASTIKSEVGFDLVNQKILCNHLISSYYTDVDGNTEDWENLLIKATAVYSFKGGTDQVTIDEIQKVSIYRDVGEYKFSYKRIYQDVDSFPAVDNFIDAASSVIPRIEAEKHTVKQLENNARAFVQELKDSLIKQMTEAHLINLKA